MVGDVVAEVEARRGVDGREPDGVDAQALWSEVVEVVDDPGQVAHPVARRIGEAARVDLVDDAASATSRRRRARDVWASGSSSRESQAYGLRHRALWRGWTAGPDDGVR